MNERRNFLKAGVALILAPTLPVTSAAAAPVAAVADPFLEVLSNRSPMHMIDYYSRSRCTCGWNWNFGVKRWEHADGCEVVQNRRKLVRQIRDDMFPKSDG